MQLFERAVGVVEHLFALTMRVAAQQTVPQFSTKGQTSAPFDGTPLSLLSSSCHCTHRVPLVERFPFLQFKVRDTLSTAVRHLAAVAQDKALDDLQCFFYEAKEDDPESISELAGNRNVSKTFYSFFFIKKMIGLYLFSFDFWSNERSSIAQCCVEIPSLFVVFG